MRETISSPGWRAAIDHLYDAVGREQQLAQALGEFRGFFGAQAASFFTVPDARYPQTSHVGAVGMTDRMLLEYHAHFSVHDVWVQAALRQPDFGVDAVCRGSALVAQDDLLGTYFGRQFVARHGLFDVLAGVVETSTDAGPVSFVSFHRFQGQPAYEPEHEGLMRGLVGHMRQVLRLHRRLAPRLALGATLHEIVQRLDTPLVFLGADGTIVGSNPAAAAALDAEHPWLLDRAGRLCVAGGHGWQEIAASLRALGSDALTLDLVNDRHRCATLELMPVQAAATDALVQHPAVAIACLRIGARDKLLALRQVHGLTAAEARVALRLADGHSATEIASAMGLSIATIRSHIAAALGKLGVERQTQLVLLVQAL